MSKPLFDACYPLYVFWTQKTLDVLFSNLAHALIHSYSAPSWITFQGDGSNVTASEKPRFYHFEKLIPDHIFVFKVKSMKFGMEVLLCGLAKPTHKIFVQAFYLSQFTWTHLVCLPIRKGLWSPKFSLPLQLALGSFQKYLWVLKPQSSWNLIFVWNRTFLFKVPFKIPHKISCHHIERFSLYTDVKF